MKLLTKTTLYFLLAMMLLLAAGGFLLFQQFSRQINQRADKELVYEEVQWIQYLEAATANGSNFILRSPDLLIYPVDAQPDPYPQITSTYGTKAREEVQIPFRQLTHVVSINGLPYQIIIRKSQEQKLALVTRIASILLLVFAGLFAATLLFNWIISKRLWQPFRHTLQQIRNLELQKMEAIRFEETSIEEFNELNASLNTMVRKIQSDYLNMKEFTEDAAHEMQTPLAVAQSKLELLLQDQTLQAQQVEDIAQASAALNRLSKLNQSLLLLAKIENNQYEATGALSLVAVARKYLAFFDEMIKDKQLRVEVQTDADFFTPLHPFLADTLISNLTGNAIKYNNAGGSIRISSNENRFCISNSSPAPALATEQLFRRFHTSGNGSSPSNGLGLALVKKIADTNHLQVSYQYKNGLHQFCLQKKENPPPKSRPTTSLETPEPVNP